MEHVFYTVILLAALAAQVPLLCGVGWLCATLIDTLKEGDFGD